ncbi:hypothetical protein HDU76_002039 [Blyttiomyces sp. JEL0837]|nr:hypothetical protein HDU76_002039 [Blyttiomyces sp. JEL0837]
MDTFATMEVPVNFWLSMLIEKKVTKGDVVSDFIPWFFQSFNIEVKIVFPEPNKRKRKDIIDSIARIDEKDTSECPEDIINVLNQSPSEQDPRLRNMLKFCTTLGKTAIWNRRETYATNAPPEFNSGGQYFLAMFLIIMEGSCNSQITVLRDIGFLVLFGLLQGIAEMELELQDKRKRNQNPEAYSQLPFAAYMRHYVIKAAPEVHMTFINRMNGLAKLLPDRCISDKYFNMVVDYLDNDKKKNLVPMESLLGCLHTIFNITRLDDELKPVIRAFANTHRTKLLWLIEHPNQFIGLPAAKLVACLARHVHDEMAVVVNGFVTNLAPTPNQRIITLNQLLQAAVTAHSNTTFVSNETPVASDYSPLGVLFYRHHLSNHESNFASVGPDPWRLVHTRDIWQYYEMVGGGVKVLDLVDRLCAGMRAVAAIATFLGDFDGTSIQAILEQSADQRRTHIRTNTMSMIIQACILDLYLDPKLRQSQQLPVDWHKATRQWLKSNLQPLLNYYDVVNNESPLHINENDQEMLLIAVLRIIKSVDISDLEVQRRTNLFVKVGDWFKNSTRPNILRQLHQELLKKWKSQTRKLAKPLVVSVKSFFKGLIESCIQHLIKALATAYTQFCACEQDSNGSIAQTIDVTRLLNLRLTVGGLNDALTRLHLLNEISGIWNLCQDQATHQNLHRLVDDFTTNSGSMSSALGNSQFVSRPHFNSLMEDIPPVIFALYLCFQLSTAGCRSIINLNSITWSAVELQLRDAFGYCGVLVIQTLSKCFADQIKYIHEKNDPPSDDAADNWNSLFSLLHQLFIYSIDSRGNTAQSLYVVKHYFQLGFILQDSRINGFDWGRPVEYQELALEPWNIVFKSNPPRQSEKKELVKQWNDKVVEFMVSKFSQIPLLLGLPGLHASDLNQVWNFTVPLPAKLTYAAESLLPFRKTMIDTFDLSQGCVLKQPFLISSLAKYYGVSVEVINNKQVSVGLGMVHVYGMLWKDGGFDSKIRDLFESLLQQSFAVIKSKVKAIEDLSSLETNASEPAVEISASTSATSRETSRIKEMRALEQKFNALFSIIFQSIVNSWGLFLEGNVTSIQGTIKLAKVITRQLQLVVESPEGLSPKLIQFLALKFSDIQVQLVDLIVSELGDLRTRAVGVEGINELWGVLEVFCKFVCRFLLRNKMDSVPGMVGKYAKDKLSRDYDKNAKEWSKFVEFLVFLEKLEDGNEAKGSKTAKVLRHFNFANILPYLHNPYPSAKSGPKKSLPRPQMNKERASSDTENPSPLKRLKLKQMVQDFGGEDVLVCQTCGTGPEDVEMSTVRDGGGEPSGSKVGDKGDLLNCQECRITFHQNCLFLGSTQEDLSKYLPICDNCKFVEEYVAAEEVPTKKIPVIQAIIPGCEGCTRKDEFKELDFCQNTKVKFDLGKIKFDSDYFTSETRLSTYEDDDLLIEIAQNGASEREIAKARAILQGWL